MARTALMEVGDGRRRRRDVRRRRRLRLVAALGGLAVAGAAVVVVVAVTGGDTERQLVSRYVAAWARGDYPAMYAMVEPSSRAHMTESQFGAAYVRAARTATVEAYVPGRVGSRRGNHIAVRMLVRTKVFGTLHEVLEVPLAGSGSAVAVRFSNALLFPGLRSGERLTRQVSMPPRAALLAADGTPLARGAKRISPIPDVASQITGVLGPIPTAETATYAAEGYPSGALVGLDGLERVFEPQLAGTPGGTLSAGTRVIASVPPTPGQDITTTIEPAIERAAISALAGRYGGIVAMDPRSGALRALVGVAFSALQPPGSTMKIITATGALAAGIVKLTDSFPIATATTLDGYTLQNANGEACGGTLLNAFAVSCNSVFAPLGAKLGARRLVSTAERFGFNHPSSIRGAAESTIPSARAIGSDLAVGSSAIGQGMVQASTLEMTDVAATIAMGGRRPVPTLQAAQPPHFIHVTSRRVARLVQQMMVAVVQSGTGTAAQIPGVEVAGKTGTAELANTALPNTSNTTKTKETDAWFVGYAPVGAPRVVVGALFPNQGAGGATAAPAAREVLVAALQAR